MWRALFIPKVFLLLLRAWSARRELGRKPLQLPPVAPVRTIGDKALGRQLRLADPVIRMVSGLTGHPCFYRSIALASLLRPQGIPVVVNVGGRSLGIASRMKAHTWLTLGGEPFHEQPNAMELYTLDMGYNADRSVRYWIGPDFDDTVLQDENVARGNALRARKG